MHFCYLWQRYEETIDKTLYVGGNSHNQEIRLISYDNDKRKNEII